MLGTYDSVIHASTNANFSAFCYTQVVIGADTTVVINGTTMNLVGATSFNVKVTSISGGTSVYLIGCPKNVIDNANPDGTYSLP